MNESMPLVEHAAYWVIPIQGREVTRCLIDFAFGLELWVPDDLITIRIEGTFLFKVGDQEYHLDPGKQPTSLGIALSILHKRIDSAIAYKDGKLKLNFADQTYISVPPDDEYEAWEVSGSGGVLLVCMPGGTLAAWQPT